MQLWIAGAGGVGREALDVALAADIEVSGFVDGHKAGTTIRDLPAIGPDELPAEFGFIVAIGAPDVRLRVAGELTGVGGRPRTLIHPRAIVGPLTGVADGCLVSGNVHISSSVTVGPHVQVHYNATVGHDCVLDAGATVLPGANVAGTVHLGRAVTVGSGAIILQNLRVGEGATVGAGAVVTRDVEPGTVVVGSPARPLQR